MPHISIYLYAASVLRHRDLRFTCIMDICTHTYMPQACSDADTYV
jgi:hypothetical protein